MPIPGADGTIPGILPFTLRAAVVPPAFKIAPAILSKPELGFSHPSAQLEIIQN